MAPISIMREWLSSPRLAVIPLLLLIVYYRVSKKTSRTVTIPKTGERVLILGASSGIGRTMARQYAERGARVCVVGRRETQILEAEHECRQAQVLHGVQAHKGDILALPADFTNADDMVRVRETIEAKWNGLDTLVVAAGVSALQPLLAVAGVQAEGGKSTLHHTTRTGIQHTSNVASAAIRGNFTGPLVAAVTFIPLLNNTSIAPSIVLINSLASLIPAPTRSIYASTKAASLVLYQALAIEHPRIKFSNIIPSTVEGDFRASAVDSGPVRESNPNKTGLKKEDVARRCIQAADNADRTVFMPATMRYVHFIFWIIPSFVERMAAKKYNYTP